MLKIEKTDTYGWQAAFRGMRNPLNSWHKSDSYYTADGEFIIGKDDIALAKKLAKAGSDHRKYLRQIGVSVDITAPLYWWKEFDTYKVGTTANSCSTMHTIHSKEFTLSDFSWEDLTEVNIRVLEEVILALNVSREQYNATKDKFYWRQMVQLLPTSYEQKRTVTLNYEVLINIYNARIEHGWYKKYISIDIVLSRKTYAPIGFKFGYDDKWFTYQYEYSEKGYKDMLEKIKEQLRYDVKLINELIEDLERREQNEG